MATGSTSALAWQLLKNGLWFRYLKMTGRAGKPQAVSIEITHHCISRCIMCNIWTIPAEIPTLSIQEWIEFLSSDLLEDLRELDVTGGEPFLRKDLPDLFRGICRLKEAHLRELRSVAITTNGFLTQRVLRDAEDILNRLRESHMDLVMACAVDGVGETHDRIRNTKGAWSRVSETIEGLMKLREKFENLVIGIKTTILPVNIGEMERINSYATSRSLFTIVSPCIVTKGRYLNYDLADDLAFSRGDTKRLIDFFMNNRSLWRYHSERLVDYFITGTMKKPCTCGFNYFFVRSNGDVFLCPLINRDIGNIRDQPIDAVFLSENASRVRKRIGKYPECTTCTEAGLERYALPYEGFDYLRLLIKVGRRRFLDLHRQMGLDKYISV